MSKFLSGQLINLRVFTKSDIAVWSSWFNDSGVTEHMNKGAFPNMEMGQEEFFDYLVKSKTDVQVAIVLKENDSLIGTVGIHNIDWIHRHGDVSIVIGEKACWGKGVGREAISLIVEHAFTTLNLHKLTAGMWASNISSKRCFENNGFVLEGTLRGQFFYKKSYVDEFRFGLLRDDWELTRKNSTNVKG